MLEEIEHAGYQHRCLRQILKNKTAALKKSGQGYLQDTDCCGHYKPITYISWAYDKNTTCNNFTGGILVIRLVVLFAYLLNAHSNPA